MHISILSENEYESVCDSINDDIQLLNIIAILKVEMKKLSPTTKSYIWKVSDGQNEVYGALATHTFGKPYLFIQRKSGSFLEPSTASALIFEEMITIIKDAKSVGVVGENCFIEAFRKLMLSESPFIHVSLDEPVFFYYINDENYKKYVETYEFSNPDYEVFQMNSDYANIMMDQLLTYGEGDREAAALRLKQFPSVGIKHKASGKLSAFEYNDGYGFLAHQFTFPEFRKQGLGKATEVLLSRLNKEKLGFIPFKAVSHNRKLVIAITEGAKYWTKLDRTDNNNEVSNLYWTFFSKEPVEKIIMRDN
uniref:Glycine N-acyltransferase-like protein n=1 Tax=Rhabditophanes sp. KR3021 TaxID=114890 RepID=A0AC35UB84_9BILA